MSQQTEKYGPIAAAPILGPSAGSSNAANDPMSPQNLAASARRQQVQASADTKYDPAVPPGGTEGFTNNVSLGVAFLLISFVLLHSSLQ